MRGVLSSTLFHFEVIWAPGLAILEYVSAQFEARPFGPVLQLLLLSSHSTHLLLEWRDNPCLFSVSHTTIPLPASICLDVVSDPPPFPVTVRTGMCGVGVGCTAASSTPRADPCAGRLPAVLLQCLWWDRHPCVHWAAKSQACQAIDGNVSAFASCWLVWSAWPRRSTADGPFEQS